MLRCFVLEWRSLISMWFDNVRACYSCWRLLYKLAYVSETIVQRYMDHFSEVSWNRPYAFTSFFPTLPTLEACSPGNILLTFSSSDFSSSG